MIISIDGNYLDFQTSPGHAGRLEKLEIFKVFRSEGDEYLTTALGLGMFGGYRVKISKSTINRADIHFPEAFKTDGFKILVGASKQHDVPKTTPVIGRLAGFMKDLLPFQQEGAKIILEGGRVMLAWEPGLGKTVASLYAAFYAMAHSGVIRCLIICPASAIMPVWQEEIDQCLAIPNTTTVAESLDDLKDSNGFVLVSYDKLLYEYKQNPRQVKKAVGGFGMVIADETHRMKNISNRTFEVMSDVLEDIPRVVFLNGTPIENNEDDVYNQAEILSPGALRPPPWGRSRTFQGDSKSLIHRIIGADIEHDLVPWTRVDVVVSMTKEQRELYKALMDEMESNPKSALGIRTKLSQICDSPALLGGSDDSPKLNSMINVLPSSLLWGRKTVIYTRFKKYAQMALDRINSSLITRAVLHNGEMTKEEKARAIRKFKNDPKVGVLVTTQAGGRGLNLENASTLISLDPWPGGGLTTQLEFRVKRLTSKLPVTIVNIRSKGTIEQEIDEIVTKKKRLATERLDHV